MNNKNESENMSKQIIASLEQAVEAAGAAHRAVDSAYNAAANGNNYLLAALLERPREEASAVRARLARALDAYLDTKEAQ